MMKCKTCLLDSSLPGVSVSNGLCNYCGMDAELNRRYPTGTKQLGRLFDGIKQRNKGNEYDCVIGVSGGCDSSYLCLLAKEHGLNPIAAHFDNTFNSKTAVENIHTVLKQFDIPLFTVVVDNAEMDDLAKSFLLASVPDIDAITDIALTSTLYAAAEKYGVRDILNGHSFRTEGVTPPGWFYFDGAYIADVHRKYGTVPLKHFPNLTIERWCRWLDLGIKRHRPLYFVDYDKTKAKAILGRLGWVWYGSHHGENRYTKFCDRHILPVKFGIDLRLIEYSALIRNGMMTLEEARQLLVSSVECEDDILREMEKRFGVDMGEVMRIPPRSRWEFDNYLSTFKKMKPYFKEAVKQELVPMSFYIKYCGGEMGA